MAHLNPLDKMQVLKNLSDSIVQEITSYYVDKDIKGIEKVLNQYENFMSLIPDVKKDKLVLDAD